jgi:ligand-binding sensor domain-containing protein
MFAPRRLRFLVWGIAGIASFFAAAPVALHAQGGTLWVGESVGAFRIATADGTVLGEIEGLDQQVSALAVDPVAERVWLYSGNSLLAYSLDGEPELSVPVPGFPFQVPEMAVDPLAGTVWLADLVLNSPRVTGFDASGQVIADEIAPERVRALAVDSQSGLVWVAGERDLYSYDTTSGIAASTLSLGPSAAPVQAIAVGAGGALWVATEDDLRGLGRRDGRRGAGGGGRHGHGPRPALRRWSRRSRPGWT